MNSDSRPRYLTMTHDDELVREPLSPQAYPPQPPHSVGRSALLAALAALLVLTIVGTTALVLHDLRLSQPAGRSRTSAPVAATATKQPSGTPIPSDPQRNGWTPVSGVTFADVQFTQGSGQRGYLCGMGAGTSTRLVGVTTDGGTTWQIRPSPAGSDSCWLQVSATNPLDVVLLSSGRCSQCAADDMHYSTDGGTTWRAAPFPPNTLPDAGAVWAGTYMYVGADSNPGNPQQAVLKVSANGGAFTTLDPNALVPGASGVFIQQMVVGGTTVYITLAYSGCSSAQGCTAVVASADGGKTWRRITDTFNMHVVWVAGSTLYGEVFGQAGTPVIQTSTDNGASWEPLGLPPLPDGSTVNADIPGSLLPAADGTVFAAQIRAGTIAYLHAGSWTVLPFSSDGDNGFGTVTFGRDGRPARVWVFSSPGPTSPTLYRHDLQIV